MSQKALKFIALFVLCFAFLTSCNGSNDRSVTIFTDNRPPITDLEIYKLRVDKDCVFKYESLSDIGEFSSYEEDYLVLKDKNGLEIKIYEYCPYIFYLDDKEVIDNFQIFVDELFFGESIDRLRYLGWGKDFSLEKVVSLEELPSGSMADTEFIAQFIEVNDIYYYYSKSDDNSAVLKSIAVILNGSLLCFKCSLFEDYEPINEDNILTCLLAGNPDGIDLASTYFDMPLNLN